MKTRNLIKSVGGALVAAVLIFSSSANADPVTQLIHFDDAGNGWAWYSDADNNFLFDPANFSSAAACADTTQDVPPGSPNGSCVLEGKGQNGLLPTMTRPSDGPYLDGSDGDGYAIGSSNKDPEFGNDSVNQLFTLDAFYFFLNGEGGTDPITDAGLNAITVTGNPLALGGDTRSYTFQLGGTYAGNPNVTFYEDGMAGDAAGALVKDTGYIATFGDLFADVTWIEWSSPSSANTRLDCVVATFDGTTTEAYDPATSCGFGEPPPPPNRVPEPGTLALLGLGLVGVGLTRRRRKV